MLKRYSTPQMRDWWSDLNKFQTWFVVEQAWLKAKEECHLVPKGSAEKVRQAVKIDVDRIEALEAEFHHDLIAFVTHIQEQLEAAGFHDLAGEFHKGLTSYDTEDPATMLLLREAFHHIQIACRGLLEALQGQAYEYKSSFMIARTHGQYAEPTTFGILLSEMAEEVRRDLLRLVQLEENELSFGKMSGATGSYGGMDPQLETLALGYLGLKPSRATQILSRDRHATALDTLATVAGTIERIAQTFWAMMRSDCGELEEPRGSKQRGSSAMPHKKNPIKTEQLFGLPRLVYGYAMVAHLNQGVFEGRDISQSSVERHIFPDATSLVEYMLLTMTKLVNGLVVHSDVMLRRLERDSLGIWAAGPLKNALIDAGVNPNTAYTFVQEHSFKAQAAGEHLEKVISTAVPPGQTHTVEEILGRLKLHTCFNYELYLQTGLAVYFPDR